MMKKTWVLVVLLPLSINYEKFGIKFDWISHGWWKGIHVFQIVLWVNEPLWVSCVSPVVVVAIVDDDGEEEEEDNRNDTGL